MKKSLYLLKKITLSSNSNSNMKGIIKKQINKNCFLDFYELIELDYALIMIPKNIDKEKVFVVSSHYDCVYNFSLFEVDNNELKGTFDNSIGISTNILLLDKKINDLIIVFTDREETDREGIKNVIEYLDSSNYSVVNYFVLDVTTEETQKSTTIENCNIRLSYINDDIIKIKNKLCGYDEAKYLIDHRKKALSICCVLIAIDNVLDCHSEKGCLINVSNYEKYYDNAVEVIRHVKEG